MTVAPPAQDASLSLLQRLVEDAMDPGYREAAAAGERVNLGWRSTFSISLVLFLIGLLVVAAVLQVRAGAPNNDETRAELIERVDAATAAVQAAGEQVDGLTAQVQRAGEDALSGSADDQALADELNTLEATVGGSAVTGSGLQITMSDGPPAPAGEGGPDLARVLDTDIQLAVNGLFAAGAEAVAVNGQRVTVVSPIRSAGEAVLVDFRPLTPPYLIEAVGPAPLTTAFEEGLARQELAGLEAAYGIGVDVSERERITVPSRPDLRVRYAHERQARAEESNQGGTP